MIFSPESNELEEFSFAMMSYAAIANYLQMGNKSSDVDLNKLVFGTEESLIHRQVLTKTMEELAEGYLYDCESRIKSQVAIKGDSSKGVDPKLERGKGKIFVRESLNEDESLKDKLKTSSLSSFK